LLAERSFEVISCRFFHHALEDEPRRGLKLSPGAHPPGFPVRLGGVNELHAAFREESRTRCHGWGRAVGNPGSFAFFAKGGIPRISIPTVAYPTLCQERKGWGTRLFVVLPAVPNTDNGLTENLFLIRKPHTEPCLGQCSRNSRVLDGCFSSQPRFFPGRLFFARCLPLRNTLFFGGL
jgi:hypothetical protein